MEKLDELLGSLSLPIKLPEEAFISIGKRKIPDFDIIFAEFLPSKLEDYLLASDNAFRCQGSKYLFPLISKGHLVINIENAAIVKLYYLMPPEILPTELQEMLNKIREQKLS